MKDFELDTFPDTDPSRFKRIGYTVLEWLSRGLGIPPPNRLDLLYREEDQPLSEESGIQGE